SRVATTSHSLQAQQNGRLSTAHLLLSSRRAATVLERQRSSARTTETHSLLKQTARRGSRSRLQQAMWALARRLQRASSLLMAATFFKLLLVIRHLKETTIPLTMPMVFTSPANMHTLLMVQ